MSGGDLGNGCPPASDGKSSYWLDACEDVSCDDYVVEFVGDSSVSGAVTQTETQVKCHDAGFFGGRIDQILDSLQNGVEDSPAPINAVHDSCSPAQQALPKERQSGFRSESVNSNGKSTPGGRNTFKNGDVDKVKRAREFNDIDQRHEKKARGSDSRGGNRIQDRVSERKRNYGSDDMEMDGRPRGQVRRRERDNPGKRKDKDSQEARGYWERDRGTNELVFRKGSWENIEEKARTQIIEKLKGASEENGTDEQKEKLPEEQARRYQLDVLEQAKKRNTIAFLETGAGKTLIAVLLMKSVSMQLQKQNKKMLSVFLVPKVPLVYQVLILSGATLTR